MILDFGTIAERDQKDILDLLNMAKFVGIIENLPSREYHGLKNIYWSSSDLKALYSTSPQSFKEIHMNEHLEPSKEMILGSLVHSLVLTPHEVDEQYIVSPDYDGRTKAGKEIKEQFEREAAGRKVIKDEVMRQAQRMAESVYKKRSAIKLLVNSQKETSFFWQCPFSGLPFRSRVDAYNDNNFIELKTTVNANPEVFAKQIFNLNYDLSLQHYLEGFRNLHQDTKLGERFHAGMMTDTPIYFIAIESDGPYICQPYRVADTFLELGHQKWLSAVTALDIGVSQDIWPGYFNEEVDEYPTIFPPGWIKNLLIKEEE